MFLIEWHLIIITFKSCVYDSCQTYKFFVDYYLFCIWFNRVNILFSIYMKKICCLYIYRFYYLKHNIIYLYSSTWIPFWYDLIPWCLKSLHIFDSPNFLFHRYYFGTLEFSFFSINIHEIENDIKINIIRIFIKISELKFIN